MGQNRICETIVEDEKQSRVTSQEGKGKSDKSKCKSKVTRKE